MVYKLYYNIAFTVYENKITRHEKKKETIIHSEEKNLSKFTQNWHRYYSHQRGTLKVIIVFHVLKELSRDMEDTEKNPSPAPRDENNIV